jgi:glucan-binding YG repeat protein
LKEAKANSQNTNKVLWNFQTLLQGIPDWNQDKVIRETDKIQKDCKCDYLDELLTAVFIAHTKVLSAIRLTTKQKKLQITIPKVEHFIHRLLSESARVLWTNAFLFADSNSIETQKNLRQVSALLQDSVLQAIRGLLPVKSILKEYLHDDDDGDDADNIPEVEAEAHKEESKEEAEAPKEEAETPKEEADAPKEEAEAPKEEAEAPKEEAEAPKEEKTSFPNVLEEVNKIVQEVVNVVTDVPEKEEVNTPASVNPTIYIDTKPSVSFSNDHVMFDSENLENNEIYDIPFAEAELRGDEEIDSLVITNDVLNMEADEIL